MGRAMNWEKLRTRDNIRRHGTESIGNTKNAKSAKTELAQINKQIHAMHQLTIHCYKCGHNASIRHTTGTQLPTFKCKKCGSKGYPMKRKVE